MCRHLGRISKDLSRIAGRAVEGSSRAVVKNEKKLKASSSDVWPPAGQCLTFEPYHGVNVANIYFDNHTHSRLQLFTSAWPVDTWANATLTKSVSKLTEVSLWRHKCSTSMRSDQFIVWRLRAGKPVPPVLHLHAICLTCESQCQVWTSSVFGITCSLKGETSFTWPLITAFVPFWFLPLLSWMIDTRHCLSC